ncbi:MAG: 3-hydroxyacyl-CoA dehydrogenase NAD-binding domain-containing protein [Methylacidiphilales bacterium]|nr:3-hydroxyacyl-CoA dehydrogenase NAD-binding domain-containing protein [Candidatus Methylacidiphilales bacterium]
MTNIEREMIDGKFCLLRFNQAESGANVFNLETLAELDWHLHAIANDRAIEGVVLISAKDRIFHAGADLHTLQTWSGAEVARFIERGQEVFGHLAALEKPTVAAIHGACLGGGFEMALACDYRIATSDRVTKIGLPETKLGILPAWGGSTRLSRLVGVTRALDVILGGKTPAAKPALRYGMIDAIAPRELLLSAALRVLENGHPPRRPPLWRRPLPNRLVSLLIAPRVRMKIARETRGHYPAIPAAAEIILASAGSSEKDSLERERVAVSGLLRTDACKNLLRLFFLGERVRKPDGPKSKPVECAAVIGAGVMGSAIAQWLSSRGVRVILRDVNPQAVAAGMERIRKLFGDRRVFTEKEARDGFDRISPTTDAVPFDHADFVIEAAVEKIEAKKKIFSQLDEQARNPETVLSTNTSALSLAEIAGATKHPGRVVGIHFFNPVHKMQLVEIVSSPQADPAMVRRAEQFARQVGKLPVVVKDSPGFVVNRILVPYLLETGLLFENGARAIDIDEAMLSFGMPMGPLRLLDEVGIDIAADVAATLAARFSDRLRVPEILAKMASSGWLGRKSGRGFYVYSGGKKVVPNNALDPFRRGDSAAALDRRELQLRLSLLLVNEAARCVEERLVSGPEMIDFAMVMGTGFAPFRGGPLRYAESFGLRRAVDQLDRLSTLEGPRYTRCELLRRLAAEGENFYED